MASLARLRCRLGRHAAASEEVWNQGYGFTRCRHCGCDLVRSLLGPWQPPPRGFRIAWRPTPTPDRAPLASRPRPVAAMPSATAGSDFMDEPPRPARSTRSPAAAAFDDFMSDAPPPIRSTGTDGRG